MIPSAREETIQTRRYPPLPEEFFRSFFDLVEADRALS